MILPIGVVILDYNVRKIINFYLENVYLDQEINFTIRVVSKIKKPDVNSLRFDGRNANDWHKIVRGS